MLVTIAYTAIGSCLVLALLSSLLASRSGVASPEGQSSGPLTNYLLASGNLRSIPVVSLLVSSSFGLNGVFYQTWLGYSVGAWGLLIQGAWAASFFLLAPHVGKVRHAKSLHDLLGQAFGPSTRVVAALCTLLGFIALMGWEVAISRETFSGLFVSAGALPADEGPPAAAWISGITVFACLIYTIYGGLKGNSIADLAQNAIKLAGFGLVAALLVSLLFQSGKDGGDYLSVLFPSLETMEAKLGYFGLITNVIFSLCWQFVDASTWQSLLASSARSEQETRRNLRWSGLAVFIAPGIIGTMLGATLAFSQGITPDNILVKAIEAIGFGSVPITFLVFFAIACCVMSLVDGLLLASGYALVVDIVNPGTSLAQLDQDPKRATKILMILRLALAGLAVLAAWGVHALLAAMANATLFQFVYLVVIPQLAIFGPVLAAILGRHAPPGRMTAVVVVSFLVGLAATLGGQAAKIAMLSDGAGALTAVLSLALAWALSAKRAEAR